MCIVQPLGWIQYYVYSSAIRLVYSTMCIVQLDTLYSTVHYSICIVHCIHCIIHCTVLYTV